MQQDNLIGQTIAGYRIVGVLGEGGMGRIYLGEQNGIKAVIKKQLDGDPETLLREARFLAALKHPHLPQVLDFEKGFMVMEFVEGKTLEEHIESLKQNAGWNTQEAYLRQVVDWGLQMADVLHYLHSQKPYPIVHRDIKPSNILLRPNGQLVLIDFGIARRVDPEKLAKRIKDTCPAGTEGYMAPEFVTFQISDPRCDIYSLGVVLHYWLSGEQPDPTGQKRLSKLTRTGDLLWDTLVEISEKCRHPEPTKRYQSAVELAAALRRLAKDDKDQEIREKKCVVCQAVVRASCRFCPTCGSTFTDTTRASSQAVQLNVSIASETSSVMNAILDAAIKGQVASLEHFRAYQRLLELEQDPGFSELVSLECLPRIEKLPHQIEAVKTALGKMGGYCLLADEVGLGKTIEAGIIIKELLLRGLVRRILILTPRALCTQWQQELFEKFDVFFLVFGRDVDYSLAWECDRVIAPYETVEDRFHRQGILGRRYDLVIMDEAHHLIGETDPRRSWMLTEFARILGRQTTYFLMLSATPLHNDLKELHTLLTLLKPGSVDDFNRFKERYIDPNDPYKPKNVEELRQRLQSVMIRNTRRRVAELPFPRRMAFRVPVQLRPEQQQLFLEFRTFVRSRLWQLNTENAYFRRSLQILVESFHSSPTAFASNCDGFIRSFRNILQSDVLETLRNFQRRMRLDLLAEKFSQTVSILQQLTTNFDNKVLVFTEYEDTAELLYRKIHGAGLSVVRYPGEDVDDDGQQALDALNAFYRFARVMVCTQNAAEGLNLQFANCLVNFDLPWDPMKLEQRIGRIQRIGGKPKVFIYNVFLQRTVEEDILEVLEKKIEMFGETIGQVEEILGNLAEDESFEQIFLDLFAGEDRQSLEQKINQMVNRSKETTVADEILAAIFEEGAPSERTPRGRDLKSYSPPPAACPNCRQMVVPGAKFCDNCGCLLVAEAQPEIEPSHSLPEFPQTPQDKLETKRCRACKTELLPNAQYCDNCGEAQTDSSPVAVNNNFCPDCGNEIPGGASFCDACGHRVRL